MRRVPFGITLGLALAALFVALSPVAPAARIPRLVRVQHHRAH
jgi:hypothetical protein